ncbi:MAG TPA: L,D-transpeptidase family protein [Anaerolineales bacterium]|nr:L,D-transpeptidase family protein [Anaerolineales bacterium]
MNNNFIEAREYVTKAREALRRGDHESARQLGEQAALRAPEMEDAWLVLAASDPNHQDALAYARKALELKPDSMRARKAVEWASGRLRQADLTPEQALRMEEAAGGTAGESSVKAVPGSTETHAYQTAIPFPGFKPKRANWLYPVLLIGAGCMLVGMLTLFILLSPTLASIIRGVGLPASQQENLWAPVEIPKPGITPIGESAFAPEPANTPTPVPTNELPTAGPTNTPRSTPTDIPTEAPTSTPAATETPAVLMMEIVEDTPTSVYVPPTPSDPVVAASGARWIDVDLSEQRLYAYEGETLVNSFIVSTGTWRTPTVKGKFKVYIRLRSADMRGPGYHLRDVPYIMYFHGDYGLHGTYWHNNFGTPMSHGCVNLRIEDAAWLYNWSSMGTVVNVHD